MDQLNVKGGNATSEVGANKLFNKDHLVRSKKRRVKSKKLPEKCINVPRWQDAPPRDIIENGSRLSDVESLQLLVPASPVSDTSPNTPDEIKTNVFETEINENNQQNVENFSSTVSELSDALELGPGDEEIFVHHQRKVTSTDSVAKDNSEYDRDFIYVVCKNLAEQIKELKQQNEVIMQDKTYFIGNTNSEHIFNEKCIKIQNAIEKNNNRVKDVIDQVQLAINKNLKEAIGKVQILVKEDIARSHEGIKSNLDSKQDSLQKELAISQSVVLTGHSALQGDIVAVTKNLNVVKNNIATSQEVIECGIQTVASNLKNDVNKVQNEIKEI